MLTTRQHRYAAFAACVTLCVCSALALLFGLGQGPEVRPLVPITATIWSLADLLTAFLLLAQFYVNGRISLAILTVAYALSGLLTWPYLLTFPGVLGPRPLTAGDQDVFVYFWMLWHSGFPALVIVAMLNDSPLKRLVSRRSIFFATAVAAILPLLVGGVVATVVFASREALPHLVINGHLQPLDRLVFHPAIVALNVLACLVLLARRKRMTTLQLWLFVALLSAALDSLLVNLSGKIYSYAWDVGKLIAVSTASIVLIMILCEIARLYSRLAQLADKLRREKDLLSETAVELIAAIDLAEEANLAASIATETKSRFLAMMSHEIRTPMNGLIGTTELLSLSALNPEQHHYVEVVRDSGQSLLRLLNDILDFSKIEAGKLDLEIMDFDLRGQISSVVALLGPPFQTKGVLLTTRVDSDVPVAVKGDPYRIRQVLINLVGNALKFTPAHGTVRVFVGAEPIEGEEITVRFTIVDSGIGMAAEVMERLFQPFSQADGSTTRKYGGTGLGLSISKQLVDLMNGQIGVDDAVDAGSSFWFTIPFLPGSSAERKVDVPSAKSSDRRALVRPRPEKVLLAEDDEVSRFLAVRQFKQLGFDITVVPDGQDAVNSFASEHFDIVFMDCNMPELNGWDATREIRTVRSDRMLRVPIIAMTAGAQSGDQQLCLAAGMDDHLAKPATLSDLRNILDRWLPSGSRDAAA